MVGSFYRQFPTSSICNGKTYQLYLTLIHAMYVNGQVMKMALHMNRLKIIFKTIILSVTWSHGSLPQAVVFHYLKPNNSFVAHCAVKA